jgi:hypothetical protein
MVRYLHPSEYNWHKHSTNNNNITNAKAEKQGKRQQTTANTEQEGLVLGANTWEENS